MDPAIIALIALVITITVGIILDVNCGIVAGILCFVLAQFLIPDMSLSDVYKNGWPTGTMFTMMSIMFLFGIAHTNGTLEIIAKKIIIALRGKNKLMPFAFYALALIIAGAGAGPGIASMILPIAMSVCIQADIEPYIMGVSVVSGSISGGMFKTSVSGVVASQLAAEAGATNYWQIYVPYLLAMFLEVVIVYFFFGGLKIKNVQQAKGTIEKVSFNSDQIKTLIIILVVLIGVLFLGIDVGMATFVGAAMLIVLRVADEREAINTINWGSLLLVSGVAMLIYIITETGGIDMISMALSKLITARTGTSIMVISGGLLSSVSSSVGVAMPTLVPTTAGIAEALGGSISVTALAAGVIAGSNGVIYCPFSTLGAMTLATVPESVDKKKYFNKMLLTGFGSVAFLAILGFIGWFQWFSFL